MPTYRFVVRTGMTGSSNRGKWSNVFHIAIADGISSESVATAASDLVSALRHVTLDTVTFYSVTVKDPTQDGSGYDASKVRSIPINLTGTKVTGVDAGEPKEIVVKLKAQAASGRPGHVSLRLALLDSEIVAGTEGEPFNAAAVSGGSTTVDALNALIAGGTEFHVYSKLKSGTVSDRAVVAWSQGGVGARTARRHRKRKNIGSNPHTWTSDAIEALKDGLKVIGGYTVAKTVLPALEAPAIDTAVAALGAAAGDLLPELVAIL